MPVQVYDEEGALLRSDDEASAGDVTGPASSTDNAIARFDGTGGKTLQNSDVLLDDSGDLTCANASAWQLAAAAGSSGNGQNLVAAGGAGDANNAGGSATIQGGEGSGTGTGGAGKVQGGQGGTTGAGGAATVQGGSGGPTSGNGGDAQLYGGLPISGNGGSVDIRGRSGVGSNKNGGDITLTAGSKTGIGTDGKIKLVSTSPTQRIEVTGTINDSNCKISGNTVSAPGTEIIVKQKPGLFVGGDLASGEFGIDTTNGYAVYSHDGSTISVLNPVQTLNMGHPGTSTVATQSMRGPGNSNPSGSNHGYPMRKSGCIVGAGIVFDVNAWVSPTTQFLQVYKYDGTAKTVLLQVDLGITGTGNTQSAYGSAALQTHTFNEGDLIGLQTARTGGSWTLDDMYAYFDFVYDP